MTKSKHLHYMTGIISLIGIMTFLLSACLGSTPDNSRQNQFDLPQPAELSRSCGDGICNGPENSQTCPEDCQETLQEGREDPSKPCASPKGAMVPLKAPK